MHMYQRTPEKNIHPYRPLIITAAILLVPLVGTQLSDEVQWGIEDFMAIGLMLLIAGYAYEFLAPQVHSVFWRVFLALTIIAIVGIIWVELAVGIFD